jgi:eukaryotic-like serine/threonine-protein kinase
MSDPRPLEAALFDAALELPPEQRPGYLDQACGDDAALRQRIQALLKAAERTNDFLDQSAAPASSQSANASSPVAEKPGDNIGPYKLLQQIGEGGCGVVYMAEQEQPVRRRVALKVIKLGMDTRQVIARFDAERQALAMMDHPNIAKVLEAGATATGRPYFVMELVRGVRITDYCDHNNLSTAARLDLFMQVCRAIQHAHQKGIIHRDIKPSNILVTLRDGVPVPKVIDFGIAKATQGKLTDHTVFTAFEQFMGTPAYASPEQAEMSEFDIDTRSDIYSLGVLLYELLTGKTPFETKDLLAAGLAEMRRIIRHKEPERPSLRLSTMLAAELTITAGRRQTQPPKLVSSLRGDLDWIVMRCLDKDRARRYETANGLASDIQRYLNQQPVTACPPSRLYRFHRLVRRNTLAFAAGAAVAAALIAGVVVSSWQAIRATRAEREQVRLRQQPDDDKRRAQTREEVMCRDVLSNARKGLRHYNELHDNEQPYRHHLAQQLVAHSLNHLASVLANECKFGEAEALYEEAVAFRKQLHGSDAPIVAETLHSFANMLRTQHRFTEAEAKDREALGPLRNTQLGQYPWLPSKPLTNTDASSGSIPVEAIATNAPPSPDYLKLAEKGLADVLHGLGLSLAAQNKLAEAEPMLREALTIRRKILGDDSPLATDTLRDLGALLRKEGKLGDAKALYSEELVRLEGSGFGNFVALNNVARRMATCSDKTFRNGPMAVTLAEKVVGDRQYPGSLDTLAAAYAEIGDFVKAASIQKEAIALSRDVKSYEEFTSRLKLYKSNSPYRE